MRPVLYESDETEFTSNGLGRPDPVSCEVTEERNGGYELHMVVSVEDPHYKDIVNDRILYARHNDSGDCQPFAIYRITRPMNGKAEVYAEHVSYRMSHIPVMPFSAGTCAEALMKLKSNAAEDCPFAFWTDKETEASFSFDDPSSMRSLLGGVDGSILDVYGGEWEFDGYTAKLHKARGGDNGVALRYGKNITDLTQEENIQNTYTGILPFWKGTEETGAGNSSGEGTDTDVEAGNEEVHVYLPEKVLHAETASGFPYMRTKVVDFSSQFQSKPTEEQLRNAAKAYIRNNDIGIPKVSVKVSFAALWQTEEYKDIAPLERVHLCDTVSVIFTKLGVKTKAKVIKTTYDCLSERYTEIEIGEAESSLAQTIVGDAVDSINSKLNSFSTKAHLEKSVGRATKLITGGQGGYVVIKLNADGQPEELLILGDSPDYTKAQEVWRWNKNGLGYSSTGYEGEYRTAVTNDGHIVADFVDTGQLTANIIRAGILQDLLGNNYWNLDTGELSIKNGSININDLFVVDSKGNLTAVNANITGNLFSGDKNSYFFKVENGRITTGYGDTVTYIDYGQQFSGAYTGRGFYIHNDNAIAIACKQLWVRDENTNLSLFKGQTESPEFDDVGGTHHRFQFINGIYTGDFTRESTAKQKVGNCDNIYAGTLSDGTNWVGLTVDGTTYFVQAFDTK